MNTRPEDVLNKETESNTGGTSELHSVDELRAQIIDIEKTLSNPEVYISSEEKQRLEQSLIAIENELRNAERLEHDAVKIAELKEEVIERRAALEAAEEEITTPAKGFRDKTQNDAKIEHNRFSKERLFKVSENELYLYESGKIDLIRNAQTFDELFRNIDTLGNLNDASFLELQGTTSQYNAEQLKSIITEVRAGNLPIEFVTRTGGLRTRVAQLLRQDPVVAPEAAQVTPEGEQESVTTETVETDQHEEGGEQSNETLAKAEEPAAETVNEFFVRYQNVVAAFHQLSQIQEEYSRTVKKASFMKKIKNFFHLGDGIDSEITEITTRSEVARGTLQAALREYTEFVVEHRDENQVVLETHEQLTHEMHLYHEYLRIANSRTEVKTIEKRRGMFLPLLAAGLLGLAAGKGVKSGEDMSGSDVDKKPTISYVEEESDKGDNGFTTIERGDTSGEPETKGDTPEESDTEGGLNPEEKDRYEEAVKKVDEILEDDNGDESVERANVAYESYFQVLHGTSYNTSSALDNPKMEIIESLIDSGITQIEKSGNSLSLEQLNIVFNEAAGGNTNTAGWERVADKVADNAKEIKRIAGDVEAGTMNSAQALEAVRDLVQ